MSLSLGVWAGRKKMGSVSRRSVSARLLRKVWPAWSIMLPIVSVQIITLMAALSNLAQRLASFVASLGLPCWAAALPNRRLHCTGRVDG